MQIRKLLCGIGACAVFLASCSSPLEQAPAPSATPSPSATTTASSSAGTQASQLIAAIPRIDQLLPKSLQAGQSSAASAAVNVLRSTARLDAQGDVSELTPSLLPGVTANGYQQLKNSISNSMITTVLDILKSGLKDRDIPLDTVVALGNITFPSYTGMGTQNGGKVKLSKPSADVIEVLWTMTISNQGMTGTYYFKVRIKGNDAATMQVAMVYKAIMTYNGQSMDQSGLAFYDATTKEMFTYSPPTAAGGYGYVQSLSTDNGIVKYYSRSGTLIDDGYLQVAYANDSMGGVVNANSYTANENGVSVTRNSINTEFYNGNGNLVMTQWGSQDTSNYSWVNDQFSSNWNAVNVKEKLNISTKPSTVKIKRVFSSAWDENYTTCTYENKTYVLADNNDPNSGVLLQTATWTNQNWPQNMWVNPVWQEATGTVQSGDSLYYYQSGTWDSGTWDSATRSWTNSNIDTYQIGFTVPSKTSYLGKEYYLQNRFMLKFLNLVPELVTAGYKIKMKEGQTWYGWQDSNSQWQNGTAKPANWDSIESWKKSTWTQYEYWLENTAWTDVTDNGTSETNDSSSYNQDRGDLRLDKMREDSFWYWSDGSGKVMKAHVLDTTESSPVGFSFDSAAQTIVDNVKSEIESYYTEIDNSASWDALKTRADSIITMPPLSDFPQ